MIEAVHLLTRRRAANPVCVAVHGVFADGSIALLAEAGARVVTSNTIQHATNDIDVGEVLASAISELAPLPSPHKAGDQGQAGPHGRN
jgi:ribose-phosphate pyrophosphokinase